MSGRGGRGSKGTKSDISGKGGTQTENTQKDVNKDPDQNAKTKVQPTAEQLRLAQLYNVNTKIDDRDMEDKIDKVMELTGRSKDDAVVALHDCDQDANRAIDLLLEGDGQGEWETSGKKRKSKPPVSGKSDKDGGGDKEKSDVPEGNVRDRSHGRAIPRLQKRGGSTDNRGWRNRENKENEKNLEDTGNPLRSRGGRMGSGPGRGGRDRGRGSGRGPRMFQNKSQSRKGHSNHGVIPNPIEVWNNSQVESKGSSHDKITVGTWNNFPAAEEWDNEEWTGSLSDTKIFTRSLDQSTEANPNHIIVSNDSTANQVSAMSHSPIPTMSTSNSQVSHLQSLLQKPSMMQNSQPTLGSVGSNIGNNISSSNGLNQMTPSQQFLSQFTQQSSETIKAGVSVSPTSSYPNTNNPNSSCHFSNFTSSSSSNCVQNFSNEQLVSYSKSSGTAQTQAPLPVRPKQTRTKLPPSSKIPSAPVEMPDDSISKLDVQFGELEFGKESPNFDFTYNATDNSVNANGSSGTKSLENYSSVSTQVSSASSDLNAKPQVPGSNFPGGQSGTSYQPTNTSYSNNPSYPSQSAYSASQTSSFTNTQNSYVNNGPGSGTTGYSSNSATYQSNVTTYTQSQSNNTYQSVSQPNSSYQAQSVPSYGSSSTYSGTSAGSQYQTTYGNNASAVSTPSTLANMSNAKLTSGLSNNVKDTQYEGSSANPPNLSTTLPSNGNNTNVALGFSSVNTVSSVSGSTKGTISSNGTYDGKVNNMPSIPPGVPMLNTQYILGQAAGMPPFYTASLQPPVYYDDISLLQQRLPHMATSYYELAGFQAQTSLATGSANIATAAPGREANLAGVTVPFSVAAENSKFRNDTSSSSPVQTTLSQQGGVTQQQPYINPPAAAALPQYAYYISGGVMPGSFPQYPTPQAIFPIPPATNTHNIATTQFQKLGSGTGYNNGYSNFDSLSGHTQDYSKSYGANATSAKQSGVNTVSTGNPASDLSASYAKAHASLGKVNSYDKQGFHGATPPPYNFAGTGATTLGPNYGPHVFIPALHAPHSQMITQLHQDAGPGGNQRSQTGSQGNKGATKQSFNTNYWATN